MRLKSLIVSTVLCLFLIVSGVIADEPKKFQFQAEITQLLHIIIHSLYSNREIFLRELISNGSDALDKIRFLSLKDSNALTTNPNLEIRVRANKELRTLTITDSGVGMSEKELVDNLGTIARSGTKAFLEKLKNMAKDSNSNEGTAYNSNLIGQFGVGFYSAFLVADKVRVRSKSNDSPKQYVWESTAADNFEVYEDPEQGTLARGTELTLHLKEGSNADEKSEMENYLNDAHLKSLLKRYSEFISFPIYLHETLIENVEQEVPVEEPKKEVPTEDAKKEKEAEKVEIEKEDTTKPKTEKKMVEKKTEKWTLVNEYQPIWTRDPKTIADKEYNEFYKNVFGKGEYETEPLAYTHFKAEGSSDFKSILYIPKQPPHNMYDFSQHMKSIRLYVKRVFITDDLKDLIPRYLNFLKGVIDSDDLPLNVSRELLQSSKILKMIKKRVVGKAIQMLTSLVSTATEAKKEMAKLDSIPKEEKEKMTKEKENEVNLQKSELVKSINKYDQFWKSYGKNIKLGIIEETEQRSKLVPLLRFFSSKSEFFHISFEDYIQRMPQNLRNKPNVEADSIPLLKKQKYIYYVAGENLEELRNSPFMEQFYRKNIEVLFLLDPIDEYMMQAVEKYDNFALQSIAREGMEINDEEDDETSPKDEKAAEAKKEQKLKDKQEVLEKQFKSIMTFFKKNFVDTRKITKVVMSTSRAEEFLAPCVLLAPKFGYTANMAKIMKAQTLGATQAEEQIKMLLGLRTLELNPKSQVIISLNERIEKDMKKNGNDEVTDPILKRIAELLFKSTLLNSGYEVEDKKAFSGEVLELIKAGLGIFDHPQQQQQQPQTAEEEVHKVSKENIKTHDEL